MKRLSAFIVVGIFVVLNGTAWAEISKDERNLEREVKRVNDTAAKPDGDKAVVKRLVADLKASEQQVRSLRDRNLGYGEISVVLALAQALADGATDANVQKVLVLRQGPPVMGWGQVAGQLGTKLGKTVSQVRKVANNANREIKKDHAQAGKAGKAEPQETAAEKPAAAGKPFHDEGEGRLLRQGSGAQ